MTQKFTPEIAVVDLFTQLHFAPRIRKRSSKSKRWKDHRATCKWGWRENILGIGVSEKRVRNSRVQGKLCVTFFVRRKLGAGRLLSSELIPEVVRLSD